MTWNIKILSPTEMAIGNDKYKYIYHAADDCYVINKSNIYDKMMKHQSEQINVKLEQPLGPK